MNNRVSSLVVLGFPKSGTSALMRELDGREGVKVLTAPNGSLELAWPAIMELETEASLREIADSGARLVCHKFAAYIYNPKAIQYLSENKERKFVVCIRDPSKSLVSWWNMHRTIAKTGRNKNHIAYKERDFYANCNVEEYYDRYAKDRLRYDLYINELLSAVGIDRVFVVSQERMASNTAFAADRILEFSSSQPSDAVERISDAEHQSYAERAKIVLPDTIQKELDQVYGATLVTLLKNGVRRLI
ncbi:sulfotransferase [Hyphomonadaceae bacterium ML37]|nr:sulfotransferase [Hyphomonadaceae bacterium ML37]